MASATPLKNLKILVIEDELLVAMQLSRFISDLGGEVVGPASNVSGAERLLNGSQLDGAVVDLRLGPETSTAVVAELLQRGVPVILTTGYAEDLLAPSLADIPRLTKPYTKHGFEEIATKHFVQKRDPALPEETEQAHRH